MVTRTKACNVGMRVGRIHPWTCCGSQCSNSCWLPISEYIIYSRLTRRSADFAMSRGVGAKDNGHQGRAREWSFRRSHAKACT